MLGEKLRYVALHIGIVILIVSAGCTTSLGSTNNAGIHIESRDDISHKINIIVKTENETVLSRTTRIGPDSERMLNNSEVPVTGSKQKYQIHVSLGDGRTKTKSFTASEFDSIEITLTSTGKIEIGYVNAA